MRIRIESEATFYVQCMIRQGAVELVWSYVLDYENSANPFPERRSAVEAWSTSATLSVGECSEVLERAEAFTRIGIKPLDALHVACAAVGGCDAFLTTDRDLLKKSKRLEDVEILDPAMFVRERLR